jgi:hypothetical protein
MVEKRFWNPHVIARLVSFWFNVSTNVVELNIINVIIVQYWWYFTIFVLRNHFRICRTIMQDPLETRKCMHLLLVHTQRILRRNLKGQHHQIYQRFLGFLPLQSKCILLHVLDT